ncbi:MAG: response regulator [Burkholderiales bacterium]|nr:response regulator [Burkholderiales bacterium]
MPEALKKPSLLFVDDEPRILSALRSVFRAGYDVVTTTDAHEAIAILGTRHFDVIVSDQRMPIMNGVQFLRVASEVSPTSVRILLTGYSDTDAIVGAINEVEVHRFMKKPWDNDTIRQTVAEAVEIAVALRQGLGDPAAPAVLPLEVVATGGLSLRESLIVVDDNRKVFGLIEAEFSAAFDVFYAPSIVECLSLMEIRRCSVLLCALDVESETDRVFLMRLKAIHPRIIVITLCSSTDSERLIELINKARIYRFVKKPTTFQVIRHYLESAIDLARRQKANPVLLMRQAAEPLPEGAVPVDAAVLHGVSALRRLRNVLFGRSP